MSKQRILVIDDSFIMRTIIKDIVDSDPDLEVVGFAENGKVGLERVRELKPDAVLLDLEMPEMNGIDMLKRLALVGKTKVIVVSSVGQTGSPQVMYHCAMTQARRVQATAPLWQLHVLQPSADGKLAPLA